MKLEEEISQVNFRNEYQKANINLMYSFFWLTDRFKTSLKAHDITLQQYNVLRILRGQKGKPISTSDIRGRMLDKMSDVSRIVDRLCRQGLVARNVCRTDKRLVDVTITEKGLELLERIEPDQNAMDQIMALTEEEVRQLNYLLDKARG